MFSNTLKQRELSTICFLAFIGLTIFLRCKTNNIDCKQEEGLLRTINITPILSSTENLLVSSIIGADYKIVRLDSLRTKILGKIRHIEQSNDSIFVFDESNQIFVFKNNGTYLNTYNILLKRQQKNLNTISCWKFDRVTKKHFAWDDFSKIFITFDGRGKILSTVKIASVFSSYFEVLKDGLVVFYNDFNDGNDRSDALLYFDIIRGDLVESFIPIEKIRPNTYYSIYTSPFYHYQDSVFYLDVFSSTEYSLSTDRCPKKSAFFDAGNAIYPLSLMNPKYDETRLQILKDKKYCFPIKSYQTSAFVYYQFEYASYIKELFYNKQRKLTTSFVSKTIDLKDLNGIYANDILFDGDHVIFVVYPGSVFDYINDLAKQDSPTSEPLKNFQKEYHVNDNPILIIGSYKK